MPTDTPIPWVTPKGKRAHYAHRSTDHIVQIVCAGWGVRSLWHPLRIGPIPPICKRCAAARARGDELVTEVPRG